MSPKRPERVDKYQKTGSFRPLPAKVLPAKMSQNVGHEEVTPKPASLFQRVEKHDGGSGSFTTSEP